MIVTDGINELSASGHFLLVSIFEVTANGVTSDAMPVVKELMKQICEKDGKSYTEEFQISLLNSEKDELEDKNRKLAELVKKIEDGLIDSDMLKAQKADYKAQIQALKDDMEKTGKDLAVVDAKLKDAEREKVALNEEVEAAIEKLRIAKNDLGRTKAELDQLQQNFDYLKKNADTDAADKKKLNETVNENNKKLEELINEELETVKKDKFVKEIEAKKLKTENEEIKENMKNLAYDKDQLSSEKKKLQDEYDQLINLVSAHEDETNNLNGSIKKDRTVKDKKKIADLEQQVQDLEYRPVGTSNIDQTEVIKRDNQIADLEKAVAALKDQNTQLDAAKKDMKKQSVEDALNIENNESHIKALEAQKKMALDNKAEAEKTAADQSDRRWKTNAPASVAQEEEKNMLNARIAGIQAQPDEERQKLDSADAARKAAESKLQEVQFNLDEANNTKEKLTKKANDLTDLEEKDKMINDLNAEVDKAQKQLDTANDDKDGNEAMKQKYQDELMSVRTELDQEKKDHTKTQLIKGKYEKDIAEIIVRAKTFEKKVQMAEQSQDYEKL
ncbi:paramyosin, long form, putative [Entamoeba invadens IP1]|uniref:Paramyosin, long form, putative n=1 Tax=Entamoeba invadens IP1 TaxID=370355 RepID=A0A0A1U9J9_ENTIV|nr:paramyosin, long form, putative [Entamoeba invadens IP1]ELP91532.1 paramyosin, long form, putative [Entamoeba invadens IP1]|eukprot:XP_004258303.1 paramyosin, long form, putative [Entamoeba invadens IP1]